MEMNRLLICVMHDEAGRANDWLPVAQVGALHIRLIEDAFLISSRSQPSCH